MEEIGIRALKQNASAVIRKVKAGQSVIVTDHGVPAAQIVPIKQTRVEQLIEAGLARPAVDSSGNLPEPIEEIGLSATLLNMRGEERF